MRANFTMLPPSSLAAAEKLRSTLLDYYLEVATGVELADWLRGLGQEEKGNVAEKRARVRSSTKYLGMPAADFPQQTINYLEQYSSRHLSEVCEALGLGAAGTADAKWRRILREVGLREGWLPRPAVGADAPITVAAARPYVEWHMILKRGEYEKDFYAAFTDEMEEVFGSESVHEQLPIAFGTTLKIDFHLGHPQREGVGVEFKLPTNNADLQRALGQMDQYQSRYGDRLIVVLFADFLDKAQQRLFVDKLTERSIAVIVK